jgi:hypothetical protein
MTVRQIDELTERLRNAIEAMIEQPVCTRDEVTAPAPVA